MSPEEAHYLARFLSALIDTLCDAHTQAMSLDSSPERSELLNHIEAAKKTAARWEDNARGAANLAPWE